MNFIVRNNDGEAVAAFADYEDANEWANSQGPGHPIVRVDQ